jgi:hypothetical protein
MNNHLSLKCSDKVVSACLTENIVPQSCVDVKYLLAVIKYNPAQGKLVVPSDFSKHFQCQKFDAPPCDLGALLR